MAKTKDARITELENVCAELYQVIGALAHHGDVWNHPDVVKAMDNAADIAMTHKDVLPFPKTPLVAEGSLNLKSTTQSVMETNDVVNRIMWLDGGRDRD